MRTDNEHYARRNDFRLHTVHKELGVHLHVTFPFLINFSLRPDYLSRVFKKARMITVALAGATTGFGLTVLRTFLHLNSSLEPNQRHNFVLLSRFPQPEWSAKGLEVRQISYEDHDQLVSALKDVHTLISLIGGDVSALRNAQTCLLAAARVADVKRFAPSEYAGMGYEGIDLYAASKAHVWTLCLAAKQETGMEVGKVRRRARRKRWLGCAPGISF